jgi:lysine 6-dehydrogenase
LGILRGMARALVLGGGMVGSAMAADLAADSTLEVTVADMRADVLERLAAGLGVATVAADLSDASTVTRLAGEHDVVLGALASRLGLQTLRAVIEARKPYADISFMAEDATELSALARDRGVTAVVDCGVAPGMSNMAAGHAAARLDPCDRIEIYVGGLPAVRRWPFEYKAPFAPADVLEEYTRPARVVEHGSIIVKEALTEVELLDFPGVGTLEAFNTDGLRSLVHTLDVPNMVEKTMRYPGHTEIMRVLRHTGFFSKTPIEVAGQQVVPLELTSALLFPKWAFEDGEADITVMRVIATGQEQGQPTRLVWDLFDRYDPSTNTRSMSRTTGYPCTIMARLLLEKRFDRPGVHPPEVLGKDPGVLEYFVEHLRQRGVCYNFRVEHADG